MEDIAAFIALAALLVTGTELAAPGTILRFLDPRDWKIVMLAAALCAMSAGLGILGTLRGEAPLYTKTVWPPPQDDSEEPSPSRPKAAQTAPPAQPQPAQPQPAQQDAQPSDQSGDQQQDQAGTQAPAQGNSEYKSIALTDLKLDRKRMIGQKIATSGYYAQVGEMSTLSQGLGDSSPIFIDINQLPREQRKALLECGNEECTIEVEGIVSPVFFGIGIVATSVTVRQ